MLHLLRQNGKASKADLARATHLTNAAIGGIIRGLSENGMIEEVGRIRDGSRGQPATLLQLAADGAYGLGIYLHGDRADIGLIDFSGTLVGQTSLPLEAASLEETVDRLSDAVTALFKEHPARIAKRLTGTAISLEGFSKAAQTESDQDALAKLLKTRLEEKNGLVADVAEAAIAAAQAESYFGQNHTNFAHLFFGQNLSGSFHIADALLTRSDGTPADVADLPGLAQSMAAMRQTPQVTAHDPSAEETPATPPNTGAPAEWAGPVATLPTDWPEISAREVAEPLNALMTMLNLNTVVVNGTAAREHLDTFVRTLSANMRPKVSFSATLRDIRVGCLTDQAGLIGAASLPLRNRYAPRLDMLTDTLIP